MLIACASVCFEFYLKRLVRTISFAFTFWHLRLVNTFCARYCIIDEVYTGEPSMYLFVFAFCIFVERATDGRTICLLLSCGGSQSV